MAGTHPKLGYTFERRATRSIKRWAVHCCGLLICC